jgi:predicted acyltransferase
MVGILATWLQEQLRVVWALFGAVVLLITYVVHIAMQKQPSVLLTETGDFLLTETGDRFLLE